MLFRSQRVGRADYRVGGRSRGTIYPIERTQLIDAVVAAEGMRAGAIERTVLVTNALDVLAQQTLIHHKYSESISWLDGAIRWPMKMEISLWRDE